MHFSDKEKLYLAQTEVYTNKDPQKSMQILESCQNQTSEDFIEVLAYSYFVKKDFIQAASLYEKIDKKYHQAYCLLLSGDKYTAQKIIQSLKSNPAVEWSKCLLEYIEGKASCVPTYLQIRNFLERDLNYLLKAEQLEFAQNLINCANNLITINPETFKIIGKSLFNQGYTENSIKLFTKCLEITTQDPEIYFYMAQYFIFKDDIPKAKAMLHEALDINEEYYPAKKMLDKLTQ